MIEDKRLISLDVFRGLAIFGMIIVNSSDGGYQQLSHASWNGFTFADAIFPFFLWTVGFAISISLSRRLSKGIRKGRLIAQILRRSLLLFIIGVILYNFPNLDPSSIRIFGVLQRIALCYFFASVIFIYANFYQKIAATVGLLLFYWAALVLIPIPGHGAGHLTADLNVAGFVDVSLFKGHIYSKSFDPEGLLSTIPAVATTLFGVLSWQILALNLSEKTKKSLTFLLIGLNLTVAGALLNTWIPINKNLWTPSYAIFTAGLAFLLFSLLYFAIEEKGLKLRKILIPFIIYGSNSLFIYGLSVLLNKLSVLHQIFNQAISILPILSTNSSLAFAIFIALLVFLPSLIMYRRKIFIKV